MRSHHSLGRLAGLPVDTVMASVRRAELVRVLGAAALMAVALAIPYVGPWLALGIAAWAAGSFGGLVRETGRHGVSAPFDGVSTPAGLGWSARGARLALGGAWVLLMAAPILIRHGGRALPTGASLPGVRIVMALAFLVGWVAMPLVLAAVNAHDRRGPLAPVAALGVFRRHAVAVLLALLMVPAGLVVIEGALVLFAWEYDYLHQFVSDLFPPPRLTRLSGLSYWVYDYDHSRSLTRYTEDTTQVLPVYLRGLARGFTLMGAIPSSLAAVLAPRMEPYLFGTTRGAYLAVRLVLAILILTGVGTLLTIQARWLGLILAFGSERVALAPEAPRAPETSAPAPLASWSGVSQSDSGRPAPWAPVPLASSPPSSRTAATRSMPTIACQERLANGTPDGVHPDAAPTQAPQVAPAGTDPASLGSAESATGTGAVAFGPRILIIEDERPVADALARILIHQGFRVLLAGDGEEGLRQAHAIRPDLIVLDLLLPNKPGMQVCRELRTSASTRSIPIVMATGADSEADELAGLTEGADDYVAKPYNIDVLIARIRKRLPHPSICPTITPGSLDSVPRLL